MLNLCLWIGNICNGMLLGNASIARGLARHEASRKSLSTKFPLRGEVNHIWPLAYIKKSSRCNAKSLDHEIYVTATYI